MIDTDPARFDCETCETRQRADLLWPENIEAWELWSLLSQPTVTQLHLAPWTIEAATATAAPQEKLDLLRRLETIRSIVTPPEDAPRGR